MSDSDHSPLPVKPIQPLPSGSAAAAPDPADLGTAYGMEMSIESPATQSGTDIDLNDPLGWIRRWVDRHKAG